MAVLETVGLTKRYGNLVAVDNLSLSVEAGEILGFLGPNGAGKTTSIHMMCGLLRPDSGQTLIGGKPVNSASADVRASVGICPQHIAVWGVHTCLEQLEFMGEMYGVPRRIARQRGGELLEAMGLSDRRDKLARTLSGGMQRRLNLIMALVHEPEILVLDEPEAGLDPQSRVLIRDYIRSLARRKTVILTTHNMDEADRLADRVAIIDHGRLLTVDTPERLKRQVGAGDVLEMELPDADALRRAEAVANPLGTVMVAGQTLSLRSHGVVEQLPGLLTAMASVGVKPGEMRLRENSLEDVFLALTGRRLRQ